MLMCEIYYFCCLFEFDVDGYGMVLFYMDCLFMEFWCYYVIDGE